MLRSLLVEPLRGSGKGVGYFNAPGCHPGLLKFHPFGVVGCIRMLNSKMQRQAEGGLPPCGRSKNSVRSEFSLRAVGIFTPYGRKYPPSADAMLIGLFVVYGFKCLFKLGAGCKHHLCAFDIRCAVALLGVAALARYG